MKKIICRLMLSIVLLAICSSAFARNWGYRGGLVTTDRLKTYTVATLPPVVLGRVVVISDGADSSDCSTGAGSTSVICWYNGSSWTSVGSGSGVSELDGLSDVGTSTSTAGNLLVANDSVFIATTTIPAVITVDGLIVDSADPYLNVSRASDKGAPDDGDVWYNTTTKRIRYFNGTSVVYAIDNSDFYLDGLNDVGTSTSTSGNVLSADGDSWESVDPQTLCVAITGHADLCDGSDAFAGGSLSDLSDVTTSDDTSGNILIADGSGFDSVAVSSDIVFAAGGAATIQDNSVDGTDIAVGSDAQGDILYYDGTNWVRLGAGTTGKFLKTQGAAANPIWNSIIYKNGFFINEPTDANDEKNIDYAAQNITLDCIACIVDGGGELDMDLQIDDGSPADVNGTDITCNAAGVLDCTLGGDVDFDQTDYLDIVVTSTSSTCDSFSVWWTGKQDD